MIAEMMAEKIAATLPKLRAVRPVAAGQFEHHENTIIAAGLCSQRLRRLPEEQRHSRHRRGVRANTTQRTLEQSATRKQLVQIGRSTHTRISSKSNLAARSVTNHEPRAHQSRITSHESRITEFTRADTPACS